MTPLQLIQVGVGNMGDVWLRTVRESGGLADFAAWVEVNDDIAAAQADKYSFDRNRIFKTLPEALAAVRADGLINVTPPQFHRAVSCAALEAGIPVLSEKPLAGTFEDASAIVDTANRTGVLHMVTQNYRYHVPIQTLKRVLDSGELGAVGAISVRFAKGPHFGGFRDEMPYPLIIDMAIHHFDLLRFFTGQDPLSVYGRSWNPSWSWYKGDASAALVFQFAGGLSASYDGTWCASGDETAWNAHWRIACERGVALLEHDQVSVQRWRGVPAGEGFRLNEYDAFETIPAVTLERAAQAYLLHEFHQAVTTGAPPATTCQDNLRSLGMVFDAVESFQTGNVVRSRTA